MEKDVIPGLYRHYKQKWYFVLGVSTHSETREEFVTYFPLYLDEPRLFVRPKTMFLDKMDPAATSQDFRFLEGAACDLSPGEHEELLIKAQSLLRRMGLALV